MRMLMMYEIRSKVLGAVLAFYETIGTIGTSAKLKRLNEEEFSVDVGVRQSDRDVFLFFIERD